VITIPAGSRVVVVRARQ